MVIIFDTQVYNTDTVILCLMNILLDAGLTVDLDQQECFLSFPEKIVRKEDITILRNDISDMIIRQILKLDTNNTYCVLVEHRNLYLKCELITVRERR